MNSTQTDQSIYQALDTNIPEIRVITLQQDSPDQELRCTLNTVSLDDETAFHALSYVWGTDTEKGHIYIDDHVVPIASSLATILRQFRSHHYDTLQLHALPLWIDAICINQADLEERAQQVLLMGRIYRQATRVLLWIGEGDEFSDYAFDRMGDATFRASCGELETASRTPTLDEIRVHMIIRRNLEMRRYWTRVWVFQELVLATQDPVILCGSRQMPWSWYTLCRNALLSNQWPYPSWAYNWAAAESEVPHHDDSCNVGSPYHKVLRLIYQKDGYISLGVALSFTVQLDATDPRDHIYGVLGLVPHHEMLMVDVDYRKPLERVCRDTMAAVWTSGTYRLIDYIIPNLIPGGWADGRLETPSWAPDFSRWTSLDFDRSSDLKSEGRPWREERQAQIHVEDDILTITAIKFDSIADTVEMDFNHGLSKAFHRGKAPGEVDIEPLQDIEAMAQRGLNIPIPASSRMAPFLVLRDKLPVWSALTKWRDNETWYLGVGGILNGGWPTGTVEDKERLWEILVGRHEIPEVWKMASPPELRDNLPALEAAILSPLLHSIRMRIHKKKVFISESGFLGVGTERVEAGDIITLIVGMTCMYVLRPFHDGYHILGYANVSGLMDWNDLDEAMKAGSLHEEELKIY